MAAGLFAYTSIPTFKEAREVLFEEKRLGVDVLDAIVVVGCLGTMSIFPGAVLCWCLGFGRVLVKKTQDNSKKLLLNAFGKQPRYVWLYRDGVEVQVSLDRLQAGDIIVVNTGEVVPVDGVIVEGHGDDRPARPDRRVDARREGGRRPGLRLDRDGRRQDLRLGREVGQRDGLGQDQPDPQRHGRLQAQLAAQGGAAGRQGGDPDPDHRRASGMATMGPAGAVAVLNSDFGTGIRMAAPLAMLSLAGPLRQQGHPGQGRPGPGADERDRHGPVRQDRHADPRAPRGRPGHRRRRATRPSEILRYAAAAEKKFHHPIALAILHKAEELGLDAAARPTTPSTRSATGSPSTSRARRSGSAASGSWSWRASPMPPEVAATRSTRPTAKGTRW